MSVREQFETAFSARVGITVESAERQGMQGMDELRWFFEAGVRAGMESAIQRANIVDIADPTTAPAWFDESREDKLTYADGRRDAVASIRVRMEGVVHE